MKITLHLKVETKTYTISGREMEEPKTFLFFDVLKDGKTEDTFNMRDYFFQPVDVELLRPMDAEVIREILSNPLQNAAPFAEMKLLTNGGNVVPAHLPNFRDLHGFPPIVFVLLNWGMENLSKSLHKNYLPEGVDAVIDPKPAIKVTKQVHEMKMSTFKICVASYSDALHISKIGISSVVLGMKIASRVIRPPAARRAGRYQVVSLGIYYHEVVFIPMELPDESNFDPIDEDDVFVVWNARGMCRMSFVNNFVKIFMVHMSAVFVVLETRISKHNMEEIIETLPGKYLCHLYGKCGFSGGVTVLWRPEDFIIQKRDRKHRGGPCLASEMITGVLRPKSRRRLYLREKYDELSTRNTI